MEALSYKALSEIKTFEHKKCLFCGSKSIKKNGTRDGRQRYQCKACLRRFDGENRLNSKEIWQLYTAGKQTLSQLSNHFKCSIKTIQRHLDKIRLKGDFSTPKIANVVMDTTYFGRHFGVMVLFDSISNETLSVEPVTHETNNLYLKEVLKLQLKGIKIQSIICDGRSGLPALFPDIPIQLCQFHQIKRVIGYLTKHPKSIEGQTLLALTLSLTKSTKEDFERALGDWYETHKCYINERKTNENTGKKHYVHRRLRSAYLSLKRHLPLLFTFQRYPELKIPNTTNLLESRFGDMKRKIACHQGLKMERKILFIKDYFMRKEGN